jgi:alkylresorcinol/alkylpyrone synthase
MPQIASVSSVFPPYYHTQEELTFALIKGFGVDEQKAKVIERLHRSVGVAGRYHSLPFETYLNFDSFTQRNKAWGDVALDLGEQCMTKVLHACDARPEQVSQLIFTSVTGLAVPSIDARLMNRIPFRPDMKRVPLFGLGCVAGAAGIARARDYLVGHPKEAVALLAIELCSLTVQKDDWTMANFVGSGLFGDGAAATLVVGDEHPLAREGQPKVIASQSVFFPNSEGVMGWDIRSTGFHLVLSAEVPHIAETILPACVRSFLETQHLNVKDIDVWVSHPGGPKVIDGIEKGLELPDGALDLSRECLRDVGNLSSASVLIVLEKTLAQKKIPKGSYGLLLAMGPAFCAELVLLQW